MDTAINISSGDIYAIGAPLIIASIILEACYSSWRKRAYYRLDDFGGTLGLLAGNVVIAGLLQATVLAFYYYCYQFRIINISESLPLWSQCLLAIVMIDLVFYWYHRTSHRVRMLWAIHMNHHCSEEMNFSVSFRQAWFGPISKIPFFVCLPLLGLDPSITAVAGVLSTLWGVVGHTRVIPRLGPVMEFIFNTPSAHRVHHGSNPEYIDKNFGNVFMLWDRLFGTYAAEKAPVIYGLVTNLNTNNPFKITFHVWRKIVEDIRQASSAHEVCMALFGPPEWQPDNSTLNKELANDRA